MPLPPFGLVGLADARTADRVHLHEARPIDEPGFGEAVDDLEDDSRPARLETGLLGEFAERAVDGRLAGVRLAAGARPRAVSVRREPPAEQHVAVADDQNPDAGQLIRLLDRVSHPDRAAAHELCPQAPLVNEGP